MNHVPQNRPFLPPCARVYGDVLDFEWLPAPKPVREVAQPIKLPPGWRNRKTKHLARVAREIVELDKRILESDIEHARRVGLEIERDLEIQAEQDRHEQKLRVAQADVDANAADTAKLISRVIARTRREFEREQARKHQPIKRHPRHSSR